MRARSSITSSSLIVLAVALSSGCTPEDNAVLAVTPQGSVPEPVVSRASHRGLIVLTQQPADSGVLYATFDAEFRSNGDLATLVFGNERYVDCVSIALPPPGVVR